LEDPIQVEKSKKLRSFSFGINTEAANVNITSVSANPFVEITFGGNTVKSHLIGLYNANNINAAITIGKYFEVGDRDIQKAIESYIPGNNRSQLLLQHSNEIILDAYNANPSSMAVAIENFLQLDKSDKLMILGDMFELGNESLAEHKNIIDSLLDETKTVCWFIGKDFYANKVQKDNFRFFDTFEALTDVLKESSFSNKMILIKGSRGMALERVLEYI
ncbi:MAG TPA: cyanophycin synthetase, partial [Flavobacterium sp.]|nr:cyanophycin synthetase [Flavobacterium sp.]